MIEPAFVAARDQGGEQVRRLAFEGAVPISSTTSRW